MESKRFARSRRHAVITLMCVMALVPGLTSPAQAVTTNLSELKAQLTEFMRLGYLEDADRTIERIGDIDPDQGERWQQITDYWNESLTDFEITGAADPNDPAGVPDGLPNDWSHVFVVLGHVLNNDGTPEQKLLDRLAVAKAAAAKYPNTRIVVTGGQPRGTPPVREGEVMRDWLIAEGVAQHRIIMESESSDTPDNATMTMDILYGFTGADQVDSYTLITSATHVRRGAIQYNAAAILEQRDAGTAHIIKPLGNATHMDSFDEEKYPGSGDRDLIARNVAKVASWDGRGNVEELHQNFSFFRYPLRYAHAKIVYYMSKGLTADALRAAADASDLSLTIATRWPDVIKSWSEALEPMMLNTSVPSDLPTEQHAFILLGAGEADRMNARYALIKQALDQYPNSIAVLAGNSSEISGSYTWLTSNGIPASRIVQSAAGSNAQEGAANATDAMIGLGDQIATYTLVTSGNYLRRPTVLFAGAALIRGTALRAQQVPTPVGHIVETHVSGSADAGIAEDVAMAQIAENLSRIIPCDGEYNSYVASPPPTSTLSSIEIVRIRDRVVLIGDELTPADFQVTATLSGGDSPATIDVTDLAHLDLPTPTASGDHQVGASYTYQGVTREATTSFEVRRADITELTTLVEVAQQIDVTGYTPVSAAALAAAIDAAHTLITDLDAAADEISAALAALDEAIDNLTVPTPPEPVQPARTPTVSLAGLSYNYGTSARVGVSVTVPGLVVTGGDVAVLEGATVLGRANVSRGLAQITLPRELAVGTHRITARYTPAAGSQLTAATSPAAIVTVRALRAKIGKVKVVKGKLRVGKRPRIRVVVKGTAGYRPTGKVVLRTGKKKVGSAKLKKKGNRAVAVVRTKKLKRGKMTVRYQGSKIYQSAAKKFKRVKR
ncbi:DUF218 domain-containing protein [Micrococcales bacterium KH10]|nr:DUF218 domain-containing protein [Micrococcales bacterium KH10]